jgi:multiple sugar transport system ATP-binding protein
MCGGGVSTVGLRDVSKVFPDGTVAVNRVNLEIEAGEFMVLLGPSGCGKSTILRMIAGLEDVTSGEVWLDGRSAEPLAPRERGIAMVFQDFALYPHMSVGDNIGFPLRVANVDPGGPQRQDLGGRQRARASATCSAGTRPSSPVASGSGWPWAGRSCGVPRCS